MRKANLNIEVYRDSVLGCWMGKNVGGTLGTPFEGTHEMPQVDFYTEELDGRPLANDDLDLQLIWLQAAEDYGIYHLTPRILAEYWLNFVAAPMGEYRNCISNLQSGFYPPLSGSCNNDALRWSNGGWIRSEIWACFFPGSPDEAARYAYIDACADHEGEGIWAEVFTASLESAAFINHDIFQLLKLALARIEPDCRIGKSVKYAMHLYSAGTEFATARNKMVEFNQETGFFQAPQNIGFLVLALLYGNGDFEKTILNAVRCGDDTDCTAATAGAVLGIIHGINALPAKWCDPVGKDIITKCLSGFGMQIPKNIMELTERTIAVAERALPENPALINISNAPNDFTEFYITDKSETPKLIGMRSPYEVSLEMPFARVGAVLVNGPQIVSGESKQIHFILHSISQIMGTLKIELLMPETWKAEPCCSLLVSGIGLGPQGGEVECSIIPGEIYEPVTFLPVRFTMFGRSMPEIRMIPLQLRGSVDSRIITRNGDEYVRQALRRGDKKIFPQQELSF